MTHVPSKGAERGLLALGVLLLALCSYLLATLDQRVRATEKIDKEEYAEEYARFSELMAEVFYQVEEKYVEEVEPQVIFEAALQGVFMALDPYSSYMGSENFKELEKSTEGEFSGIGIHINTSGGVLTVVSPIPGTPAARAGLLAWDRIVEIEGESTEGYTTQDAVRLLTGPVGTEVSIVVYRESERRRIPFTIVRDRIKIESVYSNVDDADYVTPYFEYLREEGIGYVRLTKFSEGVSEEIQRVLRKMKDSGIHGLVFDVRFNSGGLLTEGIAVSDLFLEKGKVIVATKGRLKEQNKVYKAKSGAEVDWPIVMLVNEGSASATEILAGALQDHNRAVLIGPNGANTFGKALVQTISPLRVSLEQDEDGNDLPNALRLTTAKYYSPDNIGEDGESIHGIGIKPDLFVRIPEGHASDLLRKGLFLGDPPLEDPTLEEEVEDVGEKIFDPTNPEAGEDGFVEQDEEKTDEAGDEELPFYMQDKDGEKTPDTRDIQLRYGVDILRALLIVEDAA